MVKANKIKKIKSPVKLADFFNEVNIETRFNESITDKKFFIPSIEQYDILLNYNYKIKQLQKICKHYKQKITGKKSDLLKNIYNYLKLSYFSIKVQKIVRGYILRLHNHYRGPAYFKRSLCNNETDFFTLENVGNIDNNQFISFKNDNGFIYGYDIVSLYNLILKSGKNSTNPYDRSVFPSDLLLNIKKLNLLTNALNIDMKINIDKENIEDKSKSIEFKIITLFQKIDEHGFITNIEWFNSLSRIHLLRYIRELGDIWNYRAQLSLETKRNICPPNGNPFVYFNNQNFYSTVSINQLKYSILKVIECLVNTGVSNESKSLGAFYVLAALTLVNTDAAESLPWLYQSVMHQ